MDEVERRRRVEQISTQTTRTAIRLSFEASIAVIEGLERKHKRWSTAGYLTALADAKQEILSLLAEMAE